MCDQAIIPLHQGARILGTGGVAAFDRGANMDAIAAVGGIYNLIGTDTRARIATLLCMTVSPVTYIPLGGIHWFQAKGDEFTGVFKPTALGSATFAWGSGSGSRSTAGLIINGDGVIAIDGLAKYPMRTQVASAVRLSDLAMIAGNGAWVGLIRDSDLTSWVGGGLGVSPAPTYACTASISGTLAAPTLTVNTAFLAPPDTAAELWLICQASFYTAAPHAGWSWGQISNLGGPLTYIPAQAIGSHGGISTTDRRVAFGGRGGIKARHLVTEISGGAL